MKSDNISSTSNLSKILVIVITVVITVAAFKLFQSNPPIDIHNGTISEPKSAEDWFTTFKFDKKTFDQRLANTTIDIYGPVTKITSKDSCLSVEIDAIATANGKLLFSNCGANKEYRERAMKALKFGDEVRIKGEYSASGSSDSVMVFTNCRVITSN